MNELLTDNQSSIPDVLAGFCQVAPFINSLTVSEFAFCVSDTSRYVAYAPCLSLDVKIKVGDPVASESPVALAIRNGKRTVLRVEPSELVKTAYIAVAVPVHDKDGKVIGAAAQMETVERQERLHVMSTQLDKAMRRMLNVMSSIQQESKRLAAVLQEVVADAGTGHDHSQKASKLVKSVESLAEQARILGLNAMIEAARAGDAGKSFAVVAGEMRILSTESKSGSQEINKIVRAIQATSLGIKDKITNVSQSYSEQVSELQAVMSLTDDLGQMASKLMAEADAMSRITWT